MISLLNLTAGERVDLADFAFASQDSLVGMGRSVAEGVLTAPDKQALWIVRGFELSNPSGQVLQVSNGSAVLALRNGAQIQQGVVTTDADGQSTQSIDLSGYAGATYNVYIRFVLTPGAYDTRTFYRASGGGAEYAQSVPTRLTGNWELQVATASPGAEWLQIGQVTSPSMAIADMRPMYFEGRLDQSTASGWGTGNDRSADRADHGVTDLQTALSAVRQCLEDIKGPGLARWYTDHVAGQTIGYAGLPVAARTTWLDGNFYAQGDSAQPRITFNSDGANLSYQRSAGLMLVTGPQLGTPQGSAGTALAFCSGTDNAMLRGGFYRATASAGPQGIDAALSRGQVGQATGGLGVYGAQGVMGAQGVGLGYTLGAQAPALFVNAQNLVGIGHSAASTIANDGTLPLQLTTSSGQRRYVSFNDGASARFFVGFANNSQVLGAGGTFYGGVVGLAQNNPLIITQNGVDRGSMRANGAWVLGPLASTAAAPATLSISDAPTTALGTGFAGSGPALSLNSTVAPYPNGPLLDTKLAFNTGGTNYYNVSAGTVNFTVNDVVNGLNVLTYSNVTKATTVPGTLNAANVVATGASQTAYAYNPAVSSTSVFSGATGQVVTGTVVDNGFAGWVAALSTTWSGGYQAKIVLPIRAMQGQQALSYSVEVSAGTNNSVNCGVNFVRTDMIAHNDFALGAAQQATITNTSGYATLSSPLNNETSNPYQCWNIVLNFTSSASFTAFVHYAAVTFVTPSLNPGQQ